MTKTEPKLPEGWTLSTAVEADEENGVAADFRACRTTPDGQAVVDQHNATLEGLVAACEEHDRSSGEAE